MKRVQVAVVGGGYAGRNAAGAASSVGAETILFDEMPVFHDQLVVDERPGLRERSTEGFVFQRGSVVWGVFAGNILGVVYGDQSYQVKADRVVLATGATDLPCPFPGGSLPGVFSNCAISILFRRSVMPGRRFIVLGDGLDATASTSDIKYFGGEIVAQVAPHQIPSFKAFGEQGVDSVEIEGARLPADVVVVATGRQPDIELALMAECAIGYSEALGGFVPVRNEFLQTSKPEILSAGDAAGICDRLTAAAEGRFAGISAAHSLGFVDEDMFEKSRTTFWAQAGERLELLAGVTPAYAQV